MGARFFLRHLGMLNSMLNSSEKSGPLLAAMEGIYVLSKKIWSGFFWFWIFLESLFSDRIFVFGLMLPTGKMQRAHESGPAAESWRKQWWNGGSRKGGRLQGMARGACLASRSSPTHLDNTTSSHEPQMEFHLLLMNEELSRLLLKSIRFHSISCRLANT